VTYVTHCITFASGCDLQFNVSRCQLVKYGTGTDCPFDSGGIYTVVVQPFTMLWNRYMSLFYTSCKCIYANL